MAVELSMLFDALLSFYGRLAASTAFFFLSSVKACVVVDRFFLPSFCSLSFSFIDRRQLFPPSTTQLSFTPDDDM